MQSKGKAMRDNKRITSMEQDKKTLEACTEFLKLLKQHRPAEYRVDEDWDDEDQDDSERGPAGASSSSSNYPTQPSRGLGASYGVSPGPSGPWGRGVPQTAGVDGRFYQNSQLPQPGDSVSGYPAGYGPQYPQMPGAPQAGYPYGVPGQYPYAQYNPQAPMQGIQPGQMGPATAMPYQQGQGHAVPGAGFPQTAMHPAQGHPAYPTGYAYDYDYQQPGSSASHGHYPGAPPGAGRGY